MTTFNSTTLVAYSVNHILRNDSVSRKQWLIDNEHKLVVLLPLCFNQVKQEEGKIGEDEEFLVHGVTSPTTVLLESGVRITSD